MSGTFQTDISFEVSPTGDLSTVSELQNLEEAIFRRLITTPGSLVHHPTYGVGMKSFQNAVSKLEQKRALAKIIEEQILQDPRVEKVLGVGISEDSSNTNIIKVSVRVQAIGYGEQAFNYSVGDPP